MVSFDQPDLGKALKMKKDKKMICPYHTDIGERTTDGGIWFFMFDLKFFLLFHQQFGEFIPFNMSDIFVELMKIKITEYVWIVTGQM